MCWRGGGTIATAFLDDNPDDQCDGTSSIFGNNLVVATGGKSGYFETGAWIAHGGSGGTPNGINGHTCGIYDTTTEVAVQLPDIIATNGINYGKYGGVDGITTIANSVTRAPDPGTKILIQGGSGGIITTTITLPSGEFAIVVGKQGQDILKAISADEIKYIPVSGSRNGCILVEYGEGITL